MTTTEDIRLLIGQCPSRALAQMCTRAALRALPQISDILRYQEDNEFKEKLLMPIFRSLIVSYYISTDFSNNADPEIIDKVIDGEENIPSIARSHKGNWTKSTIFANNIVRHLEIFASSSESRWEKILGIAGATSGNYEEYRMPSDSDSAIGVQDAIIGGDLVYEDMCREIRSDFDICSRCSGLEPLFDFPLWHGERPHSLERFRSLIVGDEDYSFWIEWYDRIVSGKGLYIGLLRRIATLPSQEWELGAANISKLIRGFTHADY